MKRVLIPYFTAGNGHLMFARSIAHHILELRPDWEIRLFDAGSELPDHGLQRLFVDHWKTILAMPSFFKHAIFALEPLQGGISRKITLNVIRQSVANAGQILREWRPDMVVPTHWGAGHLFTQARQSLGLDCQTLPIWYVFTEFGRAYNLVNCHVDHYFTLSERANLDLRRVGVAAEDISPMDLFVPPDLTGTLPGQIEARQELGLDPGRFTVMFSLGGEGIGPVQDYLEAYDRIGKHAQFIVICGRNEALVDSIRTHFPDQEGSPRFRPLGYQKNLRVPLAACDIMAGKAGTTTVMEAITLGKPLIVCRPGAPNESDNKDYLVQGGFGWHRPRPRDFAEMVEALANPQDQAGQAELNRVRQNLQNRPAGDGAAELAALILKKLEGA